MCASGLSALSDLSAQRFAVDAASNGFAIVRIVTGWGRGLPRRLHQIANVSELPEERLDAALFLLSFGEIDQQVGFSWVATVNDSVRDYRAQGLVVCESRLDRKHSQRTSYLKPWHVAVVRTAGAPSTGSCFRCCSSACCSHAPRARASEAHKNFRPGDQDRGYLSVRGVPTHVVDLRSGYPASRAQRMPQTYFQH